MAKFVQPRVFLVGATGFQYQGLDEYLSASANRGFKDYLNAASEAGIVPGAQLCSMAAKVCYASLTLGHNDNVSRIRDIEANLKQVLSSGHGSVLEHFNLTFVAHNVSRVFTHELVRHRVGAAYSQTSGRYVRADSIGFVLPPDLEPVNEEVAEFLLHTEQVYNDLCRKLNVNAIADKDEQKRVTSALRRILPNGQSNDIVFTYNIRTLRHTIQARTSRHAEWEIRKVFEAVYKAVKHYTPLLVSDAKEEMVRDALEITGMRIQPYD